ncbi:hypothetical protein J3F83DRAFT_735407 [Trichoderma novae-zelandiae]
MTVGSTWIATNACNKPLAHAAVETCYGQSGIWRRSPCALNWDPGPRAGLMRASIDGALGAAKGGLASSQDMQTLG